MDPASSPRPRHLRVIPDVSDPPTALVANFVYAVVRKLGRGGNPEDQLRGPLEILIEQVGERYGLDAVPYGEVGLKELRARPDYAVDIGRSRVGYIELKRPGRGIPPDWRPDKRESEQWKKLCALPNVIYSDGYSWGVFSYGKLREPIVCIWEPGDSGLSAEATQKLLLLVRKFLTAKPDPPRSLAELITVIARLCRLLKDDVAAILGSASHPANEDLRLLAGDLRQRLFPDLDDQGFGDAYAQSITFALLLAQINGIAIDKIPLHEIGLQVAKKHSIIGRLFSALTVGDATSELPTIETLRQVIGTVDWSLMQDGETNVYVELYESFLGRYDPGKQKESGSYYTPEPVAAFMVQFVDEILGARLSRPWGFADEGVVVLDPAMGTGTFLVEVMKRVADTVTERQGKGARAEKLRELFRRRLVGFERQMAPYAVAELRLHEALAVRFETDIPAADMRFLTNTLDNPYRDPLPPTAAYKVIDQSSEEANRIKREERVLVAIGNPPHVGDAKRQGAWLVGEGKPRLGLVPATLPSIDDFRTLGGGRYESDLHGMQWYFLRWALWKVFDAHPDHPTGVVALLLPESFTDGRAFAGIREYLRRTCDAGWIIDLSPEGNRSDTRNRIFGSKVMRRLCIAVFARWRPLERDEAAVVHHMKLEGDKAQKLERLRAVSLLDPDWVKCPGEWQAPMRPVDAGWQEYPALADLMPWRSRGMTTGRPWAYAPQRETLRPRWERLLQSGPDQRRDLFEEKPGRDRTIDRTASPLPGFSAAGRTIGEEQGPCPDPVMVSYRSFDRQWVIPDNRLMERARTALWAVRSSRQIFVSEDIEPLRNGPGLIFCSFVPDIHHFHGSEASAVRPLYRDAAGMSVNVTPRLLRYLSDRTGLTISAEDFLAYVAALVAHRGYTSRFSSHLTEPGVRVPLITEADLWKACVQTGREVIWLHTFGERCSDEAAGRPYGAFALAEMSGIRLHSPVVAHPPGMPSLIGTKEIPGSEDEINLIMGDATVGPVRKEVWEYEVNGMHVIRHWFDSRQRAPLHKKSKKGLMSVNYGSWTQDLDSELLAMLSVVNGCVQLEPRQSYLLDQVCSANTITTEELFQMQILPVPSASTKGPSPRQFDTTALPGI